MRKLLSICLLAIVMGCAGTQPSDIKTVAANTMQGADAAVTLTRTLLKAKKMTPDDAESVVKAAEAVQEGVRVGRSLATTQGELVGTARIRAAAASLDALTLYLATKEK